MKTFKISQSFATSILVLGLLSYHCCNAETTSCDGTITGPGAIIGDVECANDCVLYEATVTGNVTCTIGSLVAKGDSTIAGNVFVSGAVRRIVLDDVTVLGDVEVTNATSLTKLVITKTATVNGSVSVQNTPGNVYISGSIANLVLVNSGNLFAHRLTITNALGADHGISVVGGNGVVQISGSRVGGGLSVQQHDGDIKIYGIDIDGNVNIEEVTGKLLFQKLNIIAVDTRITNINGTVTVKGSNFNLFRGLAISNVAGKVAVKDSKFNVENTMSIAAVNGNVAVVDSDLNLRLCVISNVAGSVAVKVSKFDVRDDMIIDNVAGSVAVKVSKFNVIGDMTISNVAGNVAVKDSKFNTDDCMDIRIVTGNVSVKDSNLNVRDELDIFRIDGYLLIQDSNINAADDMSITSINGHLLVLGNTVLDDFFVARNSAPVIIVGNNLARARFFDHTGGVAIRGNIIETLDCSDNVPPPDVSETNIIGSSSAQCSGL